MTASDLLQRVKENLIITFEDDDGLILGFIAAAISYAEGYQHYEPKYYETNECSENTKLAIVMLASHFYESRDGSTGGFFADNASAGEQAMKTANMLLRIDRNWKV